MRKVGNIKAALADLPAYYRNALLLYQNYRIALNVAIGWYR